MIKELKIRLGSTEKVVAKLDSLGATHIGDTTYEYTYFNQPTGKILKLTKHDGKTFKTMIEREGDRFVIKASDEVPEKDILLAELTEQYGIKRQLVNHRRIFSYDNLELSVNDIKGVGVFLIIEAEDPQLDFITDTLGIKNPEIIKDSFDNLGGDYER